MTKRAMFAGVIGAILAATTTTVGDEKAGSASKYPEAPRSATFDVYHGTNVADPFRPLEDPDAPATRAWVEAENKATFTYLESIRERSSIRRRLTELWDFEKTDPPFLEGKRYFFTSNTGLQSQKVLYTANSLDAQPRVLLDPNTLSADGTVALTDTKVSHDGRFLAYGIASAGSDWNEWKVRDVATGDDLPDLLKWIKFSNAEWSPNGRGFFYGRYPEPKPGDDLRGANYYQKVFFHRLGTSQARDVLVWEDPEHKEWRIFPQEYTDDHTKSSS